MTKETAIDKVEPPEKITLEMVLADRKDKILRMGGFTEMECARFITVAIKEVESNPKLGKCSLESVVLSLYEAAQCGLTCNSINQEGHLVPFWDGKTKATKCSFIPGYRGIIKMMYATDLFSMVDVQPVHENDYFEEEMGSHPRIIHKGPKTGLRGKFIGAYATLKDKDTGEVKHKYITKEEGMAHGQRYSNSKNKKKELVGPWKDTPEPMIMKTALRMVGKYTPSSPATERLHRMIKMDEIAENPPIDVTPTAEIKTPEELPAGEPEKEATPPDQGEGVGDPPNLDIDPDTGEVIPKELFDEQEK